MSTTIKYEGPKVPFKDDRGWYSGKAKFLAVCHHCHQPIRHGHDIFYKTPAWSVLHAISLEAVIVHAGCKDGAA